MAASAGEEAPLEESALGVAPDSSGLPEASASVTPESLGPGESVDGGGWEGAPQLHAPSAIAHRTFALRDKEGRTVFGVGAKTLGHR